MKTKKNNCKKAIKTKCEKSIKIASLDANILEELMKNENSVLIEFAKKMHVTPRQILEPNKSNDICDIRHLYCYLRCKIHDKSCTKVGREINRSHNAVSKGVRRIDFSLTQKYNNIKDMWKEVEHIPEEMQL